MLRELHTGATVQILNRKENTITQAEVLQVTPPQPQFNIQVTPQGVMPPRQVMSMRLRWNGREVVFNGLYADVTSAECSDGSGIVVCQDENALLNELKSTQANYQYLVEHLEDFKKGYEWCGSQIAMRDPEKRAEAQSAMQVEAIKKEFGGIIAEQNTKIDQLTALLQQALSGNGKKGKE